MMRRALEEDKYSALGSVVDTDSSDDDEGSGHHNHDKDAELEAIRWNHRPKRSNSGSGNDNGAEETGEGGGDGDGGDGATNAVGAKPSWMGSTTTKLDRHAIQSAMRKHLRLEGMKSVRNFDEGTFVDDAEDYLERCGGGGGGSAAFANNNGGKRSRSLSPHPPGEDGIPGEEFASDGRRIGKRRKKKKGKSSRRASDDSAVSQGGGGGGSAYATSEGSGGVDTPMSGLGNEDDWEENVVDDASNNGGAGEDGPDGEHVGEEEESSIFGQTAGASNATWVECDRCKKVRFYSFFNSYAPCIATPAAWTASQGM